MNQPPQDDLSQLSMLELFRVETENQTGILTSGLLALERAAANAQGQGPMAETSTLGPLPLASTLESLMRAAHSLKGAARIVNLPASVRVAHALEDCFVAAQNSRLILQQTHIDTLLRGVDLLANITKYSEGNLTAWERDQAAEIAAFLVDLAALMPGAKPAPAAPAAPATGRKSAAEKTRPTGSQAPARAAPKSAGLVRTSGSLPGAPSSPPDRVEPTADAAAAARGAPVVSGASREGLSAAEVPDRVLRLTAENLNRLLGLAGESLVESRWLRPFSESLQRLKRMQADSGQLFEELRQAVAGAGLAESLPGPAGGGAVIRRLVEELCRHAARDRQYLGERLAELDLFDRRSAHLANRLYLEVLRTRMRPFGDGTRRFPRMVRDLARSLGKAARLEVLGETTPVDRDILDRLEAPLAHLLRNAVDHGCESSAERARAGKPAEATIRLEARHSAGKLVVVVSDDGAGLDVERIREKLKAESGRQREKAASGKLKAEPGLPLATLPVSGSAAAPVLLSDLQISALSEGELLQFLFLPGFSLRESVTELSGRGVGLDVVQNMVRGVRGSVRVSLNQVASGQGQVASGAFATRHSPFATGLTFELHLPLTLSVLRALLVEVGGEPYAFPLAQIAQTLRLPRARIHTLEGRPHFNLGEQQVGLLAAQQVFGCVPGSGFRVPGSGFNSELETRNSGLETGLPVVVLGERQARHGLVVDRFLGERELVVQPLDARLGRVPGISAAALMEDGAPVLIVEVEDLLGSIEQLIAAGALAEVARGAGNGERGTGRRKRVLAVDDSLTVRELVRKLLASRGYLAEVAVDGLEAWEKLKVAGRNQKSETGEPFLLSTFPMSASPGYDLVITDVDMPRLDGIELARWIKLDPELKSLPVMIVSYKDRAEDRLRGLEAGADYYLTKGSFQDESLLEAVVDLIGEAEA